MTSRTVASRVRSSTACVRRRTVFTRCDRRSTTSRAERASGRSTSTARCSSPTMASSTWGATTPAELLQNELAELGHRVREVEDAVKRVEAVSGDDGRTTIEVLGADRADCDAWTETLLAIVTRKLPLWGQRNTQRHGVV